MALPHWLTRVNLAITNRLTRPLAARLPWFSVLEHVGRTSGEVHQTPLNAFRRGHDRWIVALTYGPDVQWVRNVLAAGHCRMLVQGRWLELVEPRRFRDPAHKQVPLIVRGALTLLGVEWFLEMREAR
jgi:deazaflavin-dependent oxidoreductase (nitroreductase family)